MKDDIMLRRTEYMRLHSSPPTVMFLSLEYHQRLLEYLKREGYVDSHLHCLGGMRFCGMTIHVVPTLEEGYHIA
jgi:hypothetical protein